MVNEVLLPPALSSLPSSPAPLPLFLRHLCFFVVGVVVVPEGREQPKVAGEEAGPAEPSSSG